MRKTALKLAAVAAGRRIGGAGSWPPPVRIPAATSAGSTHSRKTPPRRASRQGDRRSRAAMTFDPAIIRAITARPCSSRPSCNSPTAWSAATAFRTAWPRSSSTPRCSRRSRSNTACRRRCSSRSGDWKATSAPISATTKSRARSPRWPMTAAAPTSSARNCSMRCASSSAAISPSTMIGDWAGEFGGMQFTASDYLKNAVDFDGDGRRDLTNSIPDTLASAANFLVSLGWQRGQPWLQEVTVPQNLPWDQADLTIQHPRSQWVAWGVKAAHGALPSDNLPASMILPMGRHGPAFLAYPNFKAFLGWNSAYVYSTTVAYFATRLAGAPTVNHDGATTVAALSPQQVMELQRLLIKARLRRRRRNRRQGRRRHPRRDQKGADETRPAGGFLSDRRIDRAPGPGHHPLVPQSRRRRRSILLTILRAGRRFGGGGALISMEGARTVEEFVMTKFSGCLMAALLASALAMPTNADAASVKQSNSGAPAHAAPAVHAAPHIAAPHFTPRGGSTPHYTARSGGTPQFTARRCATPHITTHRNFASHATGSGPRRRMPACRGRIARRRASFGARKFATRAKSVCTAIGWSPRTRSTPSRASPRCPTRKPPPSAP